MTVTHSLVDKTYHLIYKGFLLGYASKSEDGFFLERGFFSDEKNYKTMSELKKKLREDLPDYVVNPPPKLKPLSIRDACRRAGYSNNGVSYAIERLKSIWPNLPSHLCGDRIFRMAMEEQAKFPYGKYACEWLVENPNVGKYDLEDRKRREIELGWRDEEEVEELLDNYPQEGNLLNYEESPYPN